MERNKYSVWIFFAINVGRSDAFSTILRHSISQQQKYDRNDVLQPFQTPTHLYGKANGGSNDNDDDDNNSNSYDEDIDPDSLGDWRKFRMQLAETGIKTSTCSDESSEADNEYDDSNNNSLPAKTKRPKSVSKKNEELLKSQNKKLAQEYINGVWAHETGEPEVGGLLCRLPLEAEIFRSPSTSYIGKKLEDKLSLNADLGYDDDEELSEEGYDIDKKKTNVESESSSNISFSIIAAKTLFWYRRAQKMINKELKKVTDRAQNGAIDTSKLGPEEMELLKLYLENQDNWQHVDLVLSHDPPNSKSKYVTINRPMALKVNESIARLILFGSWAAKLDKTSKVSDTQLLVTFLSAFENNCAVYVGGPNNQDKPAVIIHGIEDLEGSTEIGNGIGIYQGGLKAAIDGVLKGKYNPQEFRFFVGNFELEGAQLMQSIKLGKYQPIACARSIALKQCIGLPKPLWHEVMELCGGELKEISRLELNKRNDIEIEDDEGDEEE